MSLWTLSCGPSLEDLLSQDYPSFMIYLKAIASSAWHKAKLVLATTKTEMKAEMKTEMEKRSPSSFRDLYYRGDELDRLQRS